MGSAYSKHGIPDVYKANPRMQKFLEVLVKSLTPAKNANFLYFLKVFHAFALLFSKLLEMGVSEGRLFKGPLLNRWSPLRIRNKWGVTWDPRGRGGCQITVDLSAVWCIKALSHMLYLNISLCWMRNMASDNASCSDMSFKNLFIFYDLLGMFSMYSLSVNLKPSYLSNKV